MRGVRLFQSFCKAKTYISKFDSLEAEVNNLEKQVMQKKEELKRVQQMAKLSLPQYLQKELMKLFNKTYQHQSVSEQKSKLKETVQQIQLLHEEGKLRAATSSKLKEEQKQKVQLMFLTDLVRFSQKYHTFLKENTLDGDLQTGIELSHKSLDNVLQKESVEWICQKGVPFNSEQHLRIEGDSQIVRQVVQKGFKVRGSVIEKAQVK